MDIIVNGKNISVKENTTIYEIKEQFKEDSDIAILNGFQVTKDCILNKNDNVVLIKKGEIPDKDELESLMVSRHTPTVHKKVKRACVGIAGLGGLGANVAISLARIGIGKLILVDFDIVEPSNLNRQQYFIKHLGMHKTEALKQIIEDINPYINIEIHNEYITSENILDLFEEAEIIVEAFDNPKCKAELVNTVLSSKNNKVVVSASGMAGYFSNNTIKTSKINERFYIVGDRTNEAKIGCGLMAPRVAIAANHQANMVLRIIMGEKDV